MAEVDRKRSTVKTVKQLVRESQHWMFGAYCTVLYKLNKGMSSETQQHPHKGQASIEIVDIKKIFFFFPQCGFKSK